MRIYIFEKTNISVWTKDQVRKNCGGSGVNWKNSVSDLFIYLANMTEKDYSSCKLC